MFPMEASSVPKHIGIIMDGNRRFAKQLMMKPWKGHEFGARKLESVFEWCKELEIKELTLYTLSLENMNRPREEFDYLMNLFLQEFQNLKNPQHKINTEKIKVNFIGRLELLPVVVREAMRQVVEQTKNYDSGYIVNFAMAYGGRAEVIDAARRIAAAVKSGKLNVDEINDEVFSKELYLQSEPDLIIRTGGDQRTSNFLIWLASYSEWVFVPTMWPAF